jgi:hypothetical protein
MPASLPYKTIPQVRQRVNSAESIRPAASFADFDGTSQNHSHLMVITDKLRYGIGKQPALLAVANYAGGDTDDHFHIVWGLIDDPGNLNHGVSYRYSCDGFYIPLQLHVYL